MFLWDSGSTVGEISGHSKFINSIAYRPTRPYRVVTAGEDKHVCFYEGPPFKLKGIFQVKKSICCALVANYSFRGWRHTVNEIVCGVCMCVRLLLLIRSSMNIISFLVNLIIGRNFET